VANFLPGTNPKRCRRFALPPHSKKGLLEQVTELAGYVIHGTGGSISGGSCGSGAAADKIIELAGDRRWEFVFKKIDYRADCGSCLILRDAGLLGYLFD
jgi:hypothetical protein